jgi:hypothetical protein
MGLYFDVDFSGTLAPGSHITITLPYDPTIPDARARNLKIKHWTSHGWETITPSSVNTVARTVTFSVSSLSPFALAESATVDQATSLVAGFGAPTNAGSELIVGYGRAATLVARLADANGGALAGKTVVVESWSPSLKTWLKVADATPSATAGEYLLTVKPAVRTSYRMRYSGDAYNTASESATRIVYPRAYVSAPKAPKTVSRSKYYNVYGYLKPHHTAGTYPVRIYKWKKTSTGKWKSYGYVKAKATDYTSSSGTKYSKYSRKIKLPYKGTWRLKALAPKDAGHAATSYSGYDTVYVK